MSYSIVLHAGAADSWAGDSQLQEKTESFLHYLIDSAEDKLRNGESALKVVTEVVSNLEDYPQFNAGKGSALNNDGFHELEAAVIDGRTCRYRAAGGLQRTKNPIKLAHKMLDFPAPALIIGTAADELAETNGLDMVDNSYFTTDSRRLYWEAKMNKLLENHGTVGAVALDIHGNLAAANSTGGVTFKHPGRIGDTAIVGAGIYADDQVAVVCSGSGDAILQATVAGRAAAAARSGTELNDAVEKAILKSAELCPDSSCGVIAVDISGSISIHCNSRIFAVASANSSQHPKQAGIARSTIPILNQLAIFEDGKIRAGVVKYPTFPNQIVVHPQPREPVLSLEAEAFVDFFIRLRRVIQKVQSFYQAPDVAFITCRKSSSAFVFPLLMVPKSMDIYLKDDGHTTTYRPLSNGHHAVFHYVDEKLIKVEIHRPDKTGLFSVEPQQYSQTILQIWNIIQALPQELGRDTTPQLEVHPQRKGHVTIFLVSPRLSSFPKPATFCCSLPEYLTTELGPKVTDMAGLGRLAGKMAEYLTTSQS